MPSFILQVANRILVGLILVFAVYLLFRGHNAPGGGFSAALVAATGFSLFAIAEGPEPVRRALRVDPLLLVALGLALAIGAGLGAAVTGLPFLTGLWWPAKSAAPTVGTPLIFDLGVFLVVLGSILTLVLGLEET
ncbi:MAG TPA: MnhB domain-containing protein [Desulfobacterales bacterium]|jgi:multisubunit Na+/H+ antiporter MnhB subunit|nr:MnhB domain-containing protein [Desulfobacterales bacterium]